MSVYRAGLDRLLDEEFHLIAGKTVGIVTNHTGVTQDMRSNFDVLASRTDVKVGALLPRNTAQGAMFRLAAVLITRWILKRACPFTVSMARYVHQLRRCFRALM